MGVGSSVTSEDPQDFAETSGEKISPYPLFFLRTLRSGIKAENSNY